MAERLWPHGAYIRTRRMALGLSQPALAREARVTAAMISRLESGQRRGRPPLLRVIAAALQVPASELLARAGFDSEARYWREQEGAPQALDPLVRFEHAVSAPRWHPAVQRALLTLVGELIRDCEVEFRQRFDAAVARYPGRVDADTARFSVFRALLFAVDDDAPC